MSETSHATHGKTGVDQGFQSDVQRLGQYVGQLHDDLAGIAKGVSDVAQSGVAAVKEGGRDTIDAVKEKGVQAKATLLDHVACHPGASLGIAVGAGILIGLMGPAILRSARRDS
jgi:ElaB/YqjD/DUF883 family membrane-anchored ribosome-binding protein